MRYIVNVSGGLTSFEALRRTVERYGRENTTAIFADTKAENKDLYRFLDASERLLGIPIWRFAEGRTPYQVLRDERCITIQGARPCSKILKRELLDNLMLRCFGDTEYTSVFGMDWSEADRMDRLRERLAPLPVWFPLAEQPYVTKTEIGWWLEQHGIGVPELYKLGFDHNNCDGKCVAAGQGHMAHLHRVRPRSFYELETWENGMRDYLGKDIAILKRQRKGETRPLPLTQFRQEIEAGQPYEQDLWGGCGCFVD